MRHYLAGLDREYPSLPRGDRLFALYAYIVRQFLGTDWFAQNVMGHALEIKRGSFGHIEMDFSSDEIRELKTQRLFDLAELLMNLQYVAGFKDCIARMKTGDAEQIEATYAEMQFAKLLYIHDYDFQFANARGRAKGEDYDFDIAMQPNYFVCGEVKCKIESREIDPLSVLRTLRKARTQLPKDNPGIIFVKVPQEWFEHSSQLRMGEQLRQIVTQFLRSTKRIVSVKFYVSQVTFVDQHTLHRHAYDEINNPNTRFARKNWDMFKGHVVPKEWNGMPPK